MPVGGGGGGGWGLSGLILTNHQDRVVQKPINANIRLKVKLGFHLAR